MEHNEEFDRACGAFAAALVSGGDAYRALQGVIEAYMTPVIRDLIAQFRTRQLRSQHRAKLHRRRWKAIA